MRATVNRLIRLSSVLTKMKISLIVAMSQNRVIGRGLDIPWKIKGEQKRFKDLTIGQTVIMGRKTYDSIGKPLPKRKTIVVTRNESFSEEGCIKVSSLDEAFELSKEENEVFVAGGGQIYLESLNRADRVYLTVIEKEIEGDILFPEIPSSDFEKVYEERREGEIPYTYYTLERK